MSPSEMEADRRYGQNEEETMLEKHVDPLLREDMLRAQDLISSQAEQAKRLAERWAQVGHSVAAEMWREAGRQLAEIATEVAAVRKAVEE